MTTSLKLSFQEGIQYETFRAMQESLHTSTTDDSVLMNLLVYFQTNFSPEGFQVLLLRCVMLACQIGRFKFVENCLINYPNIDVNILVSYDTITVKNNDQFHSPVCLDKQQLKVSSFLHFAAASGSVDLVNFLINLGANTNICNCCNETPLFLGIGNVVIIDVLLKNESRLDHQDRYGSTPLILAVRRHPIHIVSHLLAAGANPWIKDKYGFTALDYTITDPCDKKVYDTFCTYGYVLKCDPSGQLSHFINLRNIQKVLKCYFATFSEEVKLSLMFIDACNHISNAPVFFNKLDAALSFKEKHNINVVYPQPLPINIFRQEITSHQEFLNSVFNLFSPGDIIWQALLILQRVAGKESSLALKHFHHYIIQDLKLTEDRSLVLYEHYTQLLLSYMKKNYPEPNFSGVIRDSYPPVQKLREIDFTQKNVNKINVIFSNLASCVKLYLEYLSSLHFHNQTLSNTKHDSEFIVIIRSSIIVMHSLITDKFPGSPELAKKLLDVLVSDLLLLDHQITTILHESIRLASVDFIKWIIKSGGNKWINTPNSFGNYPVHTAVTVNHSVTEVIQLLLNHGAHIDAVNNQSMSSLQLVAQSDRKCFDALKEYYPLPLYCLAAKAIVTCKVPYQIIDLPKHIKKLIQYHDPNWFII